MPSGNSNYLQQRNRCQSTASGGDATWLSTTLLDNGSVCAWLVKGRFQLKYFDRFKNSQTNKNEKKYARLKNLGIEHIFTMACCTLAASARTCSIVTVSRRRYIYIYIYMFHASPMWTYLFLFVLFFSLSSLMLKASEKKKKEKFCIPTQDECL